MTAPDLNDNRQKLRPEDGGMENPMTQENIEIKETAQAAESADLTIEQALSRIDQITKALEDPKTSLEDSFALYQEGSNLLAMTNQKIDLVQKQVQILQHTQQQLPFYMIPAEDHPLTQRLKLQVLFIWCGKVFRIDDALFLVLCDPVVFTAGKLLKKITAFCLGIFVDTGIVEIGLQVFAAADRHDQRAE